MTSRPSSRLALAALLGVLLHAPAVAQDIEFVDWQQPKKGPLSGSLSEGIAVSWRVTEPTTIVTSSRAVEGRATTFSGENYQGTPFSPAVDEGDYVSARFRPGGSATIEFSQAINDPVLHFDNLQGTYELSADFQILSGGTWTADIPFRLLGEIVNVGRRISPATTGDLDQLAGTLIFPGRHSSITITFVEGRPDDNAQLQWGRFKPTQHVDWREFEGPIVRGVLPVGVMATWNTTGVEAPAPLTRIDGVSPTFDGGDFQPNPFTPPQPESDRVAATLRPGIGATIEFSRAVKNPLLHLTNLQASLRFSAPFEVVSGAVYSSKPPFTKIAEVVVGPDRLTLGRPDGDPQRLDQIAVTLLFEGEYSSITTTMIDGVDEDSVLLQWGAREDLFHGAP